VQVLNFYSAIFADELKRGRKTATIRLGDKSQKYRKNQLVLVTIGYQYSPRERIFEAVTDQVEVMPRGDFGHDPAVASVHALRGDHVGEDLARGRDDRRAGVVAARLQREDQPGALEVDAVSEVRHMITASSPVSW